MSPEQFLNMPPEFLEVEWEAEPKPWALVEGAPGGEERVGIVLKRTYFFEPGKGCELAGEPLEEPVTQSEYVYEELKPPLVSPVCFDIDTQAFRRLTDLVVQGSANTYGAPQREVTVTVRVGYFERSIRVFGERRIEFGRDGLPQFTEPELFETMPLRYDRAYGGFDKTAFQRYGLEQMFRDLHKARPEFGLMAGTPYHYPRNPCGRGFLIDADVESFRATEVPNLEFPYEVLTPESLAVGSTENWVRGPLPACMDWQSAGWFPRIGYLGMSGLPGSYSERIAEIDYGWAPPDLLASEDPIKTMKVRPEFAQAASPGMSLAEIAPGEIVRLTNLHLDEPEMWFQLPAEMPRVLVEVDGGAMAELEPHLNAVVIRPDEEQLVMIWCAHAPGKFKPGMANPDEVRRQVTWQEVSL